MTLPIFEEIEAVVGSIPWHSASASESRKRCVANRAQAESGKKRKAETALLVRHLDAEQRRKQIADATAAALKKIEGRG